MESKKILFLQFQESLITAFIIKYEHQIITKQFKICGRNIIKKHDS